jgi:hypothetical protein
LEEILDVQSNEYFGGGHFSDNIEVNIKISHYCPIVAEDPDLKIILIKLSYDVCWFIELQDKVVIRSHFNSNDI